VGWFIGIVNHTRALNALRDLDADVRCLALDLVARCRTRR
jgi:hypothetical protein